MTPGERLDRLERAVLPRDGVDRGRLAEAREWLIAEVDRLGQAHGSGPAADPGAAPRDLDRALEQIALARCRARARP